MNDSFGRKSMLRGLVLMLAVAACGESPAAAGSGAGEVFVVDVEGEQFRVRISEPSQLAMARARMGDPTRRGLQGALSPGDGGFNRGYRWHLRPETVTFADLTMELCDALPSAVEGELDVWLRTIGRYCPWGARIVRRE